MGCGLAGMRLRATELWWPEAKPDWWTLIRGRFWSVDGWAQGFVLPSGGGQLTVTRDNLARQVSLVVELIAVAAAFVLALPGTRSDPVAEARALAALREERSGRRAAPGARPTEREPGMRPAGLRVAAFRPGRVPAYGRAPPISRLAPA